MKTISIKLFVLTAIFIFVASEMAIFYGFYVSSKDTMSDLVKNNIQSDVLKLKHFMDKNLKQNNINQLVSYLDNISSGSNLIKNIHIINSDSKLIYSTDRLKAGVQNKDRCLPVSKINSIDVFNQGCYFFGVRIYRGLEPYYYHSEVYIDERYLETLLSQKIERYGIYFMIFFLIFIGLLWISLKNILIKPLEQLRQFAYYSTKIPKKLFIREFESIRYSLAFTFGRLKKEQDELYKLSTKDSLSGLYNRLSLMDKVNWFVSKNRRLKGKFAIIFLDLDNFKNINDTRGHNVGDKVLIHISKVLLGAVRENDIVSRIGGDEFVVVLPDFEDDMMIIEVVGRIKSALSKPVKLDINIYSSITASMGIAIYPKDGEDATTLLKNADIAMYKAKDLGKNNYHFFTDNLNNIIQEKVYMQRMMTNALENENFKLFFQPKVDIKTSKIVSCEALIRLIDPKDGLIPPIKFISLAEESGFIIPLGEWIIKEAVRVIKSWENTPLNEIKVSINISAIQFRDKELLETIQESIKNIDSSKLDVELTESVLMSHFDKNIKIINKIKELGITLSLDDFGTGYSSLSYLKKIPFDTIKIDKSFIDDIEYDKQEKLFVNMIISIAKELGLSVVAEGVETKGQLKYLKSTECEIYQGFLCSKPLPKEEFEKLFLLYNGLI